VEVLEHWIGWSKRSTDRKLSAGDDKRHRNMENWRLRNVFLSREPKVYVVILSLQWLIIAGYN